MFAMVFAGINIFEKKKTTIIEFNRLKILKGPNITAILLCSFQRMRKSVCVGMEEMLAFNMISHRRVLFR